MLSKIEGVEIELRGTRQYSRATHVVDSAQKNGLEGRFAVQHLPVGSQMFFSAPVGDEVLAEWVRTGKMPRDMRVKVTEWLWNKSYCQEAADGDRCLEAGKCIGHTRFVSISYAQTPAGYMWECLQKNRKVKTIRLAYSDTDVQLGIHTRW